MAPRDQSATKVATQCEVRETNKVIRGMLQVPSLAGWLRDFAKAMARNLPLRGVAISIPKWERAFGAEFKGANYALGQLVFYRTKFQNKSKIAPNASPALMAGWKLELTLLDYQALRQGKVVIVSAPDREVYARDKIVFPLADLAEKALENLSDPSVARPGSSRAIASSICR